MPIDQKELDGEDSLLKIKRAIPLETLIEKLNAELDAEEIKFFQHNGFLTEKNITAWTIRQKARQDAHKLRGDYPSEKVEHTVSLEDKLRAIHEKREKED